jgi:hypothetical protein
MPEVDKRHKLDEDVFAFTSTKNGKVFICWHGKQVKTLSGQDAERFLDKISGLNHKDAQLLMARVTGNFKRGNER